MGADVKPKNYADLYWRDAREERPNTDEYLLLKTSSGVLFCGMLSRRHDVQEGTEIN